MTDVALFDGVPYDNAYQTDHFFSDSFRQYCDGCVKEGEFISYDQLRQLVADRMLDPIVEFFVSLRPSEDRLRWDRLVSLHLLLMAFVNSFGYKPQYSSQEQSDEVTGQARRSNILQNLTDWLPRHGLGDDKESQRIIKACRHLNSRGQSRRPPEAATLRKT